MGTLYCVKIGQTMQERFFADCFSHDYKYNQAMFVLPSLLLIEQAKKHTFVQVGSFDSLVKNILRLNNVHTNNISNGAQELIVSGLLQSLQASGNLNFFTGFSDSSGLKKALVSLFAELAKAGIEAESFLEVLTVFSHQGQLRAKDKEIATIYLAYKNYLQQGNLFDVQTSYIKAIEVLRLEEVSIPWQKIYISEFYRFDILQLEIIKLLSRKCEIDISLVYREQTGEVYQATKKAYEDVIGCGFTKEFVDIQSEKKPALNELCDKLFKYEQKQIKVGEAVKVKLFANRHQEMQEVVANIKKQILSGSDIKECAVIVRNISLYPGLRREFMLARVPVCLPDALNLFIQPLTKLVLAFLQVVAGEVRQGLDNLFSVFVMQKCLNVDIDSVKQTLAVKYFVTLEEAKAILFKEFAEDENSLIVLKDLFMVLEECPKLGLASDFAENVADFLQKLNIISCLGSLYQEDVIKQNELKLMAKTYQELLLVLSEITFDHEIAGEQEKELSVNNYRGILDSYLQARVFVEEKASDEGVKVLLASEVSGLSYANVYIIGLKEGEFPKLESENWLYNDEERKKLSSLGFLTDTVKIMAQDKLFFACSVATAKESLWLSASLSDGELMSSYMEEILAICKDVVVEKRAAKDVLPKVENIFSEEILACYLVQQGVSDLFVQSWLNDCLSDDFAVRSGIEQSKRTGLYNGEFLTAEVLQLVNKRFNMTFNPSSLESYAFCPFKFLVEYVWRLKDWQIADEFMRADFRGNFYHDCLRRFLGNFLGKSLIKEKRQFLQEHMKKVFEITLSDYQESNKLNQTYLTKQELVSIYRNLQAWLDAEINYQKNNNVVFTPQKLEWRFGNLLNAPQEERLTLPTKEGTVELRGQIDRIDSDGQDFFVTDYKLRSTPRKIDIDKGIDLQVPIYLLAVEKFLGQPVGGGYFSIENGKRDGGFWLNGSEEKLSFIGRISAKQKGMADDWQEYKEFFTKEIVDLVENICAGNFSPSPASKCPDYCVGKNICRFALANIAGDKDE